MVHLPSHRTILDQDCLVDSGMDVRIPDCRLCCSSQTMPAQFLARAACVFAIISKLHADAYSPLTCKAGGCTGCEPPSVADRPVFRRSEVDRCQSIEGSSTFSPTRAKRGPRTQASRTLLNVRAAGYGHTLPRQALLVAFSSEMQTINCKRADKCGFSASSYVQWLLTQQTRPCGVESLHAALLGSQQHE